MTLSSHPPSKRSVPGRLRLRRWLGYAGPWLLPLLLSNCGGSTHSAESPIDKLRREAAVSVEPAVVERWLVAELLEPGGKLQSVERARAKLERLGGAKTAKGELALALDDHFHGRLKAAPNRYLKAAEKARLDAKDPDAEAVAWTAIHYALDLKRNDPKLWTNWKTWVKQTLAEPMYIGWRARGELADWWVNESRKDGDSTGKESTIERGAREFGCVKELRLAGPFGHGANRDLFRSFPAEQPGPWPRRWAPETGIEMAPSQIPTERNGCFFSNKEPVNDGVFYVETFLDLPVARDLVIAIQGARAVLID